MQKKQMIRFIVFLALMIGSCSWITSPIVTPDQGTNVAFKTPEDAITHYFEGVAQSDIHKILQACAINEMAEKFRFDLYTERLGGVLEPSLSLSPTDYPLYIEANKLQLSSQVMNRVKLFTYSLLSSEAVDTGMVFTQVDAERVTRFTQDVDPKRLASLQLEK